MDKPDTCLDLFALVSLFDEEITAEYHLITHSRMSCTERANCTFYIDAAKIGLNFPRVERPSLFDEEITAEYHLFTHSRMSCTERANCTFYIDAAKIGLNFPRVERPSLFDEEITAAYHLFTHSRTVERPSLFDEEITAAYHLFTHSRTSCTERANCTSERPSLFDEEITAAYHLFTHPCISCMEQANCTPYTIRLCPHRVRQLARSVLMCTRPLLPTLRVELWLRVCSPTINPNDVKPHRQPVIPSTVPMELDILVLCSGYSGYRKIAESNNVERGCYLDEWPLSDPVLASSLPARPLVVVEMLLTQRPSNSAHSRLDTKPEILLEFVRLSFCLSVFR
ncbi:hypothetical protein J6590_042447 [Homalodisca vitripennis]|nr:hypothetical protein J6590_042447 [Homalodisca vitripennis]